MNPDFSEPQRQSSLGIIILFGDTVQKSVRALIAPSIFLIIKLRGTDIVYIILGALGIIVLLAFFAYLRYKNFSFMLDEEKQEFIINDGVLSKTSLTIQLNKIQQVNIKQSLIQQLIGVYSLEIDTAGSEKKEGSIKAIDHATATLLKQKLLSRDASIITNSDEIQASPFLKLSNNTLLKVGLTSNYGRSILLLAGFVLALFQMIHDYRKAYEDDAERINIAVKSSITLVSLCVFAGLVLLVLLATNIIRTFVKYYNFEIVKQKNALAISAGLFTKSNTLLKPNKVQVSTYSQNYFQKKLGLINLKIKQASYDTSDDSQHKKSDIEIPGCDAAERDEILTMIYNGVPAAEKEYAPNYRFLFLQSMKFIVIPTIIYLGLAALALPILKTYIALVVIYVVIVFALLYFEFKNHRLYLDQDFIIKKSGIWDVSYEIIEPHKIQALTASQYFWHRKANVGHLILHTAAGNIRFNYGNYTELQAMVNYWTYKVEKSGINWM